MQAIYDLAAKITEKYGAAGYVLSRAIVPPQQLKQKGAVIHLRVIEGYIDHVEWPAATSKYRNLFSGYAKKIMAEHPINVRTIERYVLLANDLPGLNFKSTLKASEKNQGAATLVMEMTEKPVSAELSSDNRGTKSRGPVQFKGSVTFNNTLGLHESVGLTVATVPTTKQLQYIALDTKAVLNEEGLNAFLSPYYSAGSPALPTFQALGYRSTVYGFESGLSFPLIRSREQNLTLTALGFLEDVQSKVTAGTLSHDRLRGLRLRSNYDVIDDLSGINQAIVTLSQGTTGLGATPNHYALASRAAGRVDFTKVELSANRTQPLPAGFSFYAGVNGQLAYDPLLTAEQCTYGGDRYGRAFYPSTYVGDRCLNATAEIRYDVSSLGVPEITQSQFYAYADHGDIWVLQPGAGTAHYAKGASVGGGVRIGLMDQLFLSFEVGHRIAGIAAPNWSGFFAVTAKY